MSNLDEIRSRLSIFQVVSSYVTLKKSGRNFKACCPFHQEKTPSFVVSPEKQLAYCFGCNKGGDIFTFVQEVEGVDFKEAVKILADRSGVKIDLKGFSSSSEGIREEKSRFFDLLEEATKIFEKQLWEEEAGQKVRDYLSSRSVAEKTAKKFRLGFASDSFDSLNKALLKLGYTKDELLKVGLARSKDTASDHIYDYFRCRLVFPIFDIRGRVVAFGARALKKGDDPKYLNSPDTPIYRKGSTIYGLSLAKNALKQEDCAVFVEGYMDVMASHFAGAENVIASSGTALSQEQLSLVRRFTRNLIFAFDTDSAGFQATERAIELAQVMDFSISIVRVPSGKDPDEFIQESPSSWRKLLSEAENYLDYSFSAVFSQEDSESDIGIRHIQERLLPLLKRIPSKIERDRWIRKLASGLSTDPKFIYEAMDNVRENNQGIRGQRAEQGDSNLINGRLETVAGDGVFEYFLGLLYQFPECYSSVQDVLTVSDFPSSLQSLYKIFINSYNDSAPFDGSGFLRHVPQEWREKVQVLALKAEMKNAHLAREAIQEEVLKIAQFIHNKSFASKRKRAVSKVRSNDAEKDAAFVEYCKLIEGYYKS